VRITQIRTVYGVFIVDVMQSIAVAANGYAVLCANWGRPNALGLIGWYITAVPILSSTRQCYVFALTFSLSYTLSSCYLVSIVLRVAHVPTWWLEDCRNPRPFCQHFMPVWHFPVFLTPCCRFRSRKQPAPMPLASRCAIHRTNCQHKVT
jgi:hypothetical protein